MTIVVSHPDLAQAVAGLRRTAERLHDRRRTTEQQVDLLMDGGWSGAAATAYLEGWQAWRAGCVEVLGSLEAMAGLVVAAGVDLDSADMGARDASDAITRIVERLG